MSTKLAMTFSEGNARKDNTGVPQGLGTIARLKAKQAPNGEVESKVHEDKELNEFANLLKQKSGESVWE